MVHRFVCEETSQLLHRSVDIAVFAIVHDRTEFLKRQDIFPDLRLGRLPVVMPNNMHDIVFRDIDPLESEQQGKMLTT